MSGLVEWAIFLSLSAVAVTTAAGLLLTMSMYRAGLALMSCFVALAGLFILLDADLLAAIQMMMNVGGMLVMILFMVMIMMDPGGEMMWDMKRKMNLPGPGAFSMTMPPDGGQTDDLSNEPRTTDHQHHQMMVDMAMSTAQLPWALLIGTASAVLLVVLVIRTAWPLSPVGPTRDATVMVGELLLSRYMIGFEGAAFLILAGITGAVIFAKREGGPKPPAAILEEAAAEMAIHTCPMHPEVRQPGPGQCPICGMELVPAEEAPAPAGHGERHHGEDS